VLLFHIGEKATPIIFIKPPPIRAEFVLRESPPHIVIHSCAEPEREGHNLSPQFKSGGKNGGG
jgi:hypothetical protein